MTLNPDCVRDILLTVENNAFGETLTLTKLHEKLTNYSKEEIHYCCLKLNEGGYLDLVTLNLLGCNVPQIKIIKDLTLNGHEFLENIKSDTNWIKTKNIAKKVGSSSLSTIKEIAIQVISSIITSQV